METLSKAKSKLVQNLSKKKFRDQNSRFIIEGKKLVQEALDFNSEIVDFIVQTPENTFANSKVTTYITNPKDFKSLSSLVTPDGILAVCHKPSQKLQIEKYNKIIAINSLNDPGNLGTIIRTADWFAIDAIILGPGSVDCFNSKVVQSTMGSIFRVPVIYVQDFDDFILEIKHAQFQTIGLSLQASTQVPTKKHSKLALVLGSESHGLSPKTQALLDVNYKIAGNPAVESLNLSIAAAIAMHQFFK